MADLPFEIAPATLHAWRDGGTALTILDVREPWETALCVIADSIEMPLAELPGRWSELPADRPLVVVCHHGGRSAQATAWLRSRGLGNATSLAGGIDAWAAQIDKGMRRY